MMGLLKKISAVIVIVGLMLAPALPAVAVDVFDEACRNTPNASACRDDRVQTTNDNSIFGPDGVLTKVARLIAVVVGIAAVIMIIIGGFKYVISSGDPNNIKSAKDTIMYAIIGMIVAASTQSIVLLVLERL